MKAIRACLLAFFVAFAVPASADTITFTIGELEWDDPFGFGPQLKMTSFANAPVDPTGPIPSGFAGGAFTGLVWDFTFTTPETNFLLGTPPDQLDPGPPAIFFADPLDQVMLSFSFLYSLAGIDLSYADSLVITQVDAAEFGGYAARLINLTLTTEPASVPEPGTLMLLGSGLALLAARARKRKLQSY